MAQRAKSLAQQERLLKLRFPAMRPWTKVIRGREYLVCDLRLRPTETSATYTVRCAYALGERPLICVTEPELIVSAHGIRTPHLNFDGTLCLYNSASAEWTPADSIADTVIPWTMRWLFHYEHWVVFGDWRGDPTPYIAPKPATDSSLQMDELQ